MHFVFRLFFFVHLLSSIFVLTMRNCKAPTGTILPSHSPLQLCMLVYAHHYSQPYTYIYVCMYMLFIMIVVTSGATHWALNHIFIYVGLCLCRLLIVLARYRTKMSLITVSKLQMQPCAIIVGIIHFHIFLCFFWYEIYSQNIISLTHTIPTFRIFSHALMLDSYIILIPTLAHLCEYKFKMFRNAYKKIVNFFRNVVLVHRYLKYWQLIFSWDMLQRGEKPGWM